VGERAEDVPPADPDPGRRRLLIDLTPLRRSRDFRRLTFGELVSVLGTQLTTVAVPYQVYHVTHSSLDVGLASLAQLALFQLGTVAGPAVAGLLLAGAGVRFIYWIDVASFMVTLVSVVLLSPQPPSADPGGHRPGLRSIIEGLSFVRGRQAIQGAYLIDINAMVFGMPRALFPALATTYFGGGAATLGFLYAAPGAGALLGALTTGWVSRIQRQGLAVIVAVIVWGVAITCFGLVPWLPGALLLLAVAGCADVISAVFRSTIIQLAVPDSLRGRLAGLQIAVVTGGPRIGDLESGAVAAAFGDTVSIVSGGLACVAGALVLARLLPGFRRQRV
jgi:predicted MFS family arabinose efflux permease